MRTAHVDPAVHHRNILRIIGWAARTAVPMCRRPAAHLDNFVCDGIEGLPLNPRHLGSEHDHLVSLGAGVLAEGVLAEGVQHHLGTDGETISLTGHWSSWSPSSLSSSSRLQGSA